MSGNLALSLTGKPRQGPRRFWLTNQANRNLRVTRFMSLEPVCMIWNRQTKRSSTETYNTFAVAASLELQKGEKPNTHGPHLAWRVNRLWKPTLELGRPSHMYLPGWLRENLVALFKYGHLCFFHAAFIPDNKCTQATLWEKVRLLNDKLCLTKLQDGKSQHSDRGLSAVLESH